MTQLHETFTVGEHPRLEVTLPAADLRVVEGADGAIDVRISGSRDIERVNIEQRGDTVVIYSDRGRWLSFGSFEAIVTVPPMSSVEAKVASGEVMLDAALKTARVGVTSGDVRIRSVGEDLTVKTASGDVEVGQVGGRLTLSAAAGDLRADEVGGDAEVHCASGDVVLGRVGGRIQTRTASGDVRVKSFEGSSCDCKSMSGEVQLGIPGGRIVDVDISTMSGDVRNEFDIGESGSGPSASLRVKTVSGDVVLTRSG